MSETAKTSYKETVSKLDELMLTYSKIKNDPNNAGVARALKEKVFNLIYAPSFHTRLKILALKYEKKYMGDDYKSTIYTSDDYVNEMMLRHFDNYDSKKNNNFCAYLCGSLKYTVMGMLRNRLNRTKNEVPLEYNKPDDEDPVCDENDVADPESNTETEALYGENMSIDEISTFNHFEYYSKMLTSVLQFKEHKGKRDRYYRCFASDFYITSCKTNLHKKYKMNENSAFSVMELDFNDYTLTDKCRTFEKICKIPLKTYGDIGIAQKMAPADKEIELPFINGVYASYLNVTDSSVSQQRASFREIMEKLVKDSENNE